MKLKFETVIDAKHDAVWAAFDNPDDLPRWQQNFESFEPIAGVPGQPGAVANLVYNENGKKVELRETITERREPDFMAVVLESPGSKILVVSHFETIDDSSTRWTSWVSADFRGFMKIMSVFIRGAMRKRTEGDMARFKLMVETDEAGREN